MPAKLQFIPPEQKNPISIDFSESYKRKVRAYEANYLSVVEPDIHERQQMKHWAQKGIVKPELISTRLVNICRTKLKGSDFEDENGNIINGSNAPKEGLSYTLWERIADEKSIQMGNPPDAFPLSADTFEVGKYDRPICKLETDERGNINKSTVVGAFKCFYLESTPENLTSVLSKFEKDKNFIMLVSEDGHSKRVVYNEREFLEGNLLDLVEANKGDVNGKCYLTEEYGGLNRYLKDKAEKGKERQSAAAVGTSEVITKRRYTKPIVDNNASS